MTDYVPWLRMLAKKGGKGVVGNIDARCLGHVADELERDRTCRLRDIDEIVRLKDALRPFVQAHPHPIDGTRAAEITVSIEALRYAAERLTDV